MRSLDSPLSIKDERLFLRRRQAAVSTLERYNLDSAETVGVGGVNFTMLGLDTRIETPDALPFDVDVLLPYGALRKLHKCYPKALPYGECAVIIPAQGRYLDVGAFAIMPSPFDMDSADYLAMLDRKIDLGPCYGLQPVDAAAMKLGRGEDKDIIGILQAQIKAHAEQHPVANNVEWLGEVNYAVSLGRCVMPRVVQGVTYTPDWYIELQRRNFEHPALEAAIVRS